mmetsp:Transcript_2436/g.2555  ORF Transcript_2436/g.2555 Transcript_2436/m.2555 type:complete len:356 (+) Transcript_2436:117-1184(+)
MESTSLAPNRPMVFKKSSAPRKTKEINDSVVVLRNAIFTASGRDKDVTEGIAPQFLSYNRNDLLLNIEFSAKLSRADANWAFDLTKLHMEDIYENSGYGWDDEDKMRELTEQGARFLLVREASTEGSPGGLVAFAHFRFTVQGEVMDMMAGEPCLYLWDLQVIKPCQRKGLGRHMITLLELIARREKMSFLSVPIQNNDFKSMDWISKIRGFKADYELTYLVGFDAETEGFTVMSKNLTFVSRRGTYAADTVSKDKTSEHEEVKEFRFSPVSVTDGVHEANPACQKSEKPAQSSDSNKSQSVKLELTGLTDKDVIDGLRILFREKNGRDITEDEVQQWLSAIRETDHGTTAGAQE